MKRGLRDIDNGLGHAQRKDLVVKNSSVYHRFTLSILVPESLKSFVLSSECECDTVHFLVSNEGYYLDDYFVKSAIQYVQVHMNIFIVNS